MCVVAFSFLSISFLVLVQCPWIYTQDYDVTDARAVVYWTKLADGKAWGRGHGGGIWKEKPAPGVETRLSNKGTGSSMLAAGSWLHCNCVLWRRFLVIID